MTANRPEGHDRLGPPPRTPPARDSGHGLVDTRLSCAPPPLHTTAEFTLQRCSFDPSSSSALWRASLRGPRRIERAYACSAARVVPARVGAAAVAEATRGAERPPHVSEGGGR